MHHILTDIKKIRPPINPNNKTHIAVCNTIAALLDYITRIVVGFFVNPFLVSGLGSYLYGIWQVLNRLIGYTSAVSGRPTQALKWKIVRVIDGDGIIANENKYSSFSEYPSVCYTSGPNDSSGNEVYIRFVYGIEIPKNQVSGNYSGYIRYTFTEVL